MVSKPKPLKSERKPKSKPAGSRRKVLEAQLKDMVIRIIFWRDVDCVQKPMDGWRCGGSGLAWGHYIAQGQSAWLRYDLGNVFVQCSNHNLLDYNNDKSYTAWFSSMFGLEAVRAMDTERDAHRKKERAVYELEELLAHYDDLYQDRFYADLTTESLVERGYYGEIIQDVWSKR